MSDREIAFPQSPHKQIIPGRGILAAAGFDLRVLRRSAPTSLVESSPLFGQMTKLYVGQDSFLAGPVLGAPMAVMALEELVRRGAQEVVFVGLAGSLTLDFHIGDLIAPDRGLSTEGTSAHYPAPQIPDVSLSQRFVSSKEVRGGCIWSTDGIFRETEILVETQRQKGAMVVDMESTALWAAANFRNTSLACLLVISDTIIGTEHKVGFHLPKFKEGLNRAAEIAWKSLGEMSQSD